jgi:hypothetical protein
LPNSLAAATNTARDEQRGRRAKVGHQRLADIIRQRQLVNAAALAVHQQQPATPVDVIKPQAGDLARTQPQP